MKTKHYLFLTTLSLTALLSGCASTSLESSKEKSSSNTISSMSAPGIERSIVQITDDIYRFFNNNHSSLFVVTDQGVIFIDPLNTAAAAWVKQEIESNFSQPITHVLYSHGHEDHASGAREFGDVEVISHKNTFDVISPPVDQTLIHGYNSYDKNSDGVIQLAEADGDLVETFAEIDSNNDSVLTGQETETYFFRNVQPPTQTYEQSQHRMQIHGKEIEMHHVGGNHASDMSYIFFPQESIVFYVDIISLGALPFGPLPWYSQADSQNTYDKALAIDADIAIPSHGPIGTQDDVRALQSYMADLRQAVSSAIDAGLTLENIQTNVKMSDYADWDYYAERLPQNIAGMHRALMQEDGI